MLGADHFSWLKCGTQDRDHLSSELCTQRAVGRLWKERGRRGREGEEHGRERKSNRKRARRGAGFFRNSAFQAPEIQVVGGKAPPGRGE